LQEQSSFVAASLRYVAGRLLLSLLTREAFVVQSVNQSINQLACDLRWTDEEETIQSINQSIYLANCATKMTVNKTM